MATIKFFVGKREITLEKDDAAIVRSALVTDNPKSKAWQAFVTGLPAGWYESFRKAGNTTVQITVDGKELLKGCTAEKVANMWAVAVSAANYTWDVLSEKPAKDTNGQPVVSTPDSFEVLPDEESGE